MGKNDSGGFQLLKIFTEIKFKNNPKALTERENLMLSLVEDFEEYNYIDKGLELLDLNKYRRVVVTMDRVVIDFNNSTNFGEFKKYSENALEKIQNILGLKECKRIGIRAYIGYEVDNIGVAQNYIYDNFLRSDVFDFVIDRPNISVSTEFQGYGVNFKVYSAQLTGLKITPKAEEREEGFYINNDCDIFKHNCEVELFKDLLEKLEAFQEDKLEKMYYNNK